MSTEKKPTEKTEKKEKVVKKKEIVKLEKDKQDKLKTLSKITYIIAKISKVLAIIGIVGMAIAMIFTPVLVKNIKIENGSIEVFGDKVEYVPNDGKMEIVVNNTNVGTLTDDEKLAFDYVLKELENTNMTKTFAFAELTLVFGIATMIVFFFVMQHVDKLFINIHDLDTPFNQDNLNHVKRIAYLSLILLILSVASNFISSLFVKSDALEISFVSITGVIVLYIISYVFEYACILQKDSKATIYDEINE